MINTRLQTLTSIAPKMLQVISEQYINVILSNGVSLLRKPFLHKIQMSLKFKGWIHLNWSSVVSVFFFFVWKIVVLTVTQSWKELTLIETYCSNSGEKNSKWKALKLNGLAQWMPVKEKETFFFIIFASCEIAHKQ